MVLRKNVIWLTVNGSGVPPPFLEKLAELKIAAKYAIDKFFEELREQQ